MLLSKKQKILLVDDALENITLLKTIFGNEFEIYEALNGEDALEIVHKILPDIVLLDIMMPGIDGYEVCKEIKRDSLTNSIPIIFISALHEEADILKGFEYGAADFISKPISPSIAKARVKTQLVAYNNQKNLEEKVIERTKEINQTRLEIIQKLSIASEYKDTDSSDHIFRITKYCETIARSYGLSDEGIDTLINAAPMHDIGKIGIPDKILLKEGKLTAEEWEVMKTHTTIGAKIIGTNASKLLMTARSIALEHHEKWDGSGYPRGLKENAIELNARIVAVADVFDALTSKRPYKNPWRIAKAVALINNESGKHFDPKVVDAFNDSIADIRAIRNFE